jgi:CheY-like chemotaxis protein
VCDSRQRATEQIRDNRTVDDTAGATRVNRRQGPRPQEVLVADDNEDVRELWRTCLTLSGYAVTEAVDGADAVAKALRSVPAVILMDFSMPILNGTEAVRALKLHACTRATPVIGLTAHVGPTTVDFRRICDMVLEKPVNPDTLLAALRHALRPDGSALPQA